MLGFSFVAFWPSYSAAFYLDDYKHLQYIQRYMSAPWRVVREFNPWQTGWHYRPLQQIYFLIARLLFGLNPTLYYLAALLLHTANALLVYLLARRFQLRLPAAIIASAAFAFLAVHHDALGWISSVSVLLAAGWGLLAVYAWEKYLENASPLGLVLAAGGVTLALFAREESLILPLILFVRWLQTRPVVRRRDLAFGLYAGLLVTAYVALTFLRPNWIPQDDALRTIHLRSVLSLQNAGAYLMTLFAHYWPFDPFPWLDRPPAVYGVALLTGILLVGGFRVRNQALRLGLAWWLAGITLIYVVSWQAFDVPGRYLYLSSIGAGLAAGALADRWWGAARGQLRTTAVVAALLLFFILQARQSRLSQHPRQQDIAVTAAVEAEMRAMLPDVDPEAHFYAYRLPPVPDYIQAMAAVWYDVPLGLSGGAWERLLNAGHADADTYLLDFDDGRLHNVLPALQQHAESHFLWHPAPLAEVVGPDEAARPLDEGAYRLNEVVGPAVAPRFGLFLHPPPPDEGWASLTYRTTVPAGSALAGAVYKAWGGVAGEDGMHFRLRLVPAGGQPHVLLQTEIGRPQATWQAFAVAVDDFWGEEVAVQLQVAAGDNLLHDHGYWTTPLFVVDGEAE